MHSNTLKQEKYLAVKVPGDGILKEPRTPKLAYEEGLRALEQALYEIAHDDLLNANKFFELALLQFHEALMFAIKEAAADLACIYIKKQNYKLAKLYIEIGNELGDEICSDWKNGKNSHQGYDIVDFLKSPYNKSYDEVLGTARLVANAARENQKKYGIDKLLTPQLRAQAIETVVTDDPKGIIKRIWTEFNDIFPELVASSTTTAEAHSSHTEKVLPSTKPKYLENSEDADSMSYLEIIKNPGLLVKEATSDMTQKEAEDATDALITAVAFGDVESLKILKKWYGDISDTQFKKLISLFKYIIDEFEGIPLSRSLTIKEKIIVKDCVEIMKKNHQDYSARENITSSERQEVKDSWLKVVPMIKMFNSDPLLFHKLPNGKIITGEEGPESFNEETEVSGVCKGCCEIM